MMPWAYDHMGGAGWAMALAMVLWSVFGLGLLALAIWSVARMLSARPAEFQSSAPEPTAQALAILAERYARGEIDHEEYLRRRDTITSAARR